MSEVKEIIDLLRDFLQLYANFIQGVADLEKEHNVDMSNIRTLSSSINPMEFLRGLTSLEPEHLQKSLKVLAELGTLTSIKDPLELSYKDKLTLVDKLSNMARELEHIVGVSRITRVPTDLDEQLVERCRNKDYHDVITNAFTLLEDRIREKTCADRSYYADKLIDFAFNPTSGRLILGDVDAEREGAYLLFKGAIKFLRNPPAHTLAVDEGRNAALKVMYMVDALIKLLDKAKQRQDS